MVFPIGGIYGYTIQGFMHARSIDDQNYIIALNRDGQGGPRGLNVNRAGATLRREAPTDLDPGRSRTAVEMPILTGFYSLNYPNVEFSDPPPPPPHPIPIGARPDDEPPTPSLNRPPGMGFYPIASPDYAPTTGYYPFSEVGWMLLTPTGVFGPPGSLNLGTIRGRTRINTAGYGGSGDGANFTGRYRFDQAAAGTLPSPLPSGFMTIQLDADLDHVWDYAFVQLSADDLILTVIGRVPRPGVGTGTMRKINAP